MLKVKKEYLKQDVVCYFSDGSFVKLNHADEKELEKCNKVKEYQKFFEGDKTVKKSVEK